MQGLRSGFSPFGAYGTTFPPQKRWDTPPQGTISPKSISMHSVARISPAGGDAAAGGRRGAFPSLAGRLACFPFARRAVVWFYHKGAPSFSRAPTTAFSPERSDATLLYNPWHRGPEGPMDAIRPSAPKAQAPSGIKASTAPPTGIYCHLSHLLFLPRSFALLRMTVESGDTRSRSSTPTAPRLRAYQNPHGQRPPPPLTRSPSPIDGGGKSEGRACHSPIKKEAAKAASFFNFISDQPGKP
jgi:hypothetical protein